MLSDLSGSMKQGVCREEKEIVHLKDIQSREDLFSIHNVQNPPSVNRYFQEIQYISQNRQILLGMVRL